MKSSKRLLLETVVKSFTLELGCSLHGTNIKNLMSLCVLVYLRMCLLTVFLLSLLHLLYIKEEQWISLGG